MEEEKTKLEIEREKQYEKVRGKVHFIVNDIFPFATVSSEFDDLEKALHKIKLDLITMAVAGEGVLAVKIKKVI